MISLHNPIIQQDLDKTIVFTDLDGTLLDHQSYSYDKALPALKALEKLDIPVVFVTSKTEAEVEVLRRRIGNNHPFIVENGGAVIVPAGYFSTESETHVLGRDHTEISAFLRSEREKGREFRGFFDMTASEIADVTGLPIEDATRAAMRTASEPLIWQDDDDAKLVFIRHAEGAGFQVLQGGRFLTIGGNTNKGKAAELVVSLFEMAEQRKANIIALGDSGNDVALLETATHRVWVRKHGKTPDSHFLNNAFCTTAFGPSGWNEAIHTLLFKR